MTLFPGKLTITLDAAFIETDDDVDEALESAVVESAESVLRRIRRKSRSELRKERKVRRKFEKRLSKRWGLAFDSYDLVICCSRELAGDFLAKRYRERRGQEEGALLSSLIHIHVRAHRICSEIRSLLASGHASGALARWRLLFELEVIAAFLVENGEETAEKYMLHQTIQTAKEARQYKSFYERLGYEPPDEEKFALLMQQRGELIQRFGDGFQEEWGWAFGAISGKPNFTWIAEAVKMDHWRPFVGMANNATHGGFKGMIFDIGEVKSPGRPEQWHAGATNAGLSDPGSSALLSLYRCTVALLLRDPTKEALVGLRVMDSLIANALDAFSEAHDALERDEARLFGSEESRISVVQADQDSVVI